MKELAAKRKQIDRETADIKRSLKSQVKEVDKASTAKTAQQRRTRANAKNVYDAIGFDLMFDGDDGICQVEEGLFSQTINFSDVSYQSADVEDQEAILDQYAQVFDGCGPDVNLQILVVNTPLPERVIGKQEFFKETGDPQLDQYVREYNSILNRKMMEGISNIQRNRYITYSVHADTYEEAVPKLQRVYTTIATALDRMGSKAEKLSGHDRLKLISSITRPYTEFSFDYEDLLLSKLTAKDAVCPTSLNFAPEKLEDVFKSNNVWCQALVMKKIDAQLQDLVVSELIDLPIPLCVSIHVHPLDKGTGREMARRTLMWIDKDITERQQKAVRKGYDFNNLPQELKYAKADGEELLAELQYKNQNYYEFTGVIYTYANSFEVLRDYAVRIVNTAHQKGIEVEALECQQREAFNSVIPVANNHIGVTRRLTTTQVAMFIPFATSELNQENGGYYGQNKVSNNLIMMNRSRLAAPMGWVFGQPGSGKSFGNKREISNNFLTNPSAEFIIIDPKDEYSLLVDALGGTSFGLSLDSPDRINVFEFYDRLYQSGDSNPIDHKAETIQAISSVVMGSADGELTPEEKTIIDRCVRLTYLKATDGKTPKLEDFHETLQEQPEPEAARLATAFELYVTGGLRYFNADTTVELDRRITSFSFQKLGESMRLFAMIVIMDYVYNRMLYNFRRGVQTWLYIDEVQSLFTTPAVVEYFDKFWAEGRSYNLVPTAITQTPERVINHETAKYLIRNSDFILLYKLSPIDRGPMAELLGLSPQQEEAIGPSASPGEGLLIAGASVIPFIDDWPKGKLYDLWNTKPDDLAERNREAWIASQQGRNRNRTGLPAKTDVKSSVEDVASAEDVKEEEARYFIAEPAVMQTPVKSRQAEEVPDRNEGIYTSGESSEEAAFPQQTDPEPDVLDEREGATSRDERDEPSDDQLLEMYFKVYPDATIEQACVALEMSADVVERFLGKGSTTPNADVLTIETDEEGWEPVPNPWPGYQLPDNPAEADSATVEAEWENFEAPTESQELETAEEEQPEFTGHTQLAPIVDEAADDWTQIDGQGEENGEPSFESAPSSTQEPEAELTIEKAVTKYCLEHPGSTEREIASGLGLPVKQVRTALKTVSAQGSVVKKDPQRALMTARRDSLISERAAIEIPRGTPRNEAVSNDSMLDGSVRRRQTRNDKPVLMMCPTCQKPFKPTDGTCPYCGTQLTQEG